MRVESALPQRPPGLTPAPRMPKRVLILQRNIPHYRVPVFDLLGRDYRVTTVYSGVCTAGPNVRFQPQRVSVREVAGLHYQSGIQALARDNDVIIAMFDVRWLSSLQLVTTGVRNRLLWWGHGFGQSRLARWPRARIVSASAGLILYDDAHRAAYEELGVPAEKLFIAPNTMHVPEPTLNRDPAARRSFVFVSRIRGTRKRVDLLIDGFARVADRMPEGVGIEIVGDGDGLPALKEAARVSGIEDRVTFHGEVRDDRELSAIFGRALAYVSPGHVGLGVLHAFAHGVPVVTKRGPGHAPEVSNLHDGENSLLVDETSEAFGEALLDLGTHPDKAQRLGEAAYVHYTEHRTLDHMVAGFRAAIESVPANG